MKTDRYFEFLYDTGFDDDRHKEIARYLHSRPYEWRLDMDENRKWDGIEMRMIFDNERHSPAFYSSIEDSKCTMLEFFVGFAYRLVRDMFGDEEINTHTLVEIMLSSLDIFIDDDDWEEGDEEEVDECLKVWVNGDYNNYGEGNIFRFTSKHKSLWNIHMWMQASWWYNEEFLK